ncbi:MAG: benzoate/H(+) symporter BenE family transporter [Actinomycetales bacterium]
MLRGRADLLHAATAGVVTSLVGFTGAFAIVLAGLRAVGATPAQAGSGLLTVTVLMGLCSLLLSVWQRLPIVVAWSTPGAALLVATGPSHGGWSAAVGAFVICGLLLALVGVWTRLGRLIALIPVQVASAMLAGVLFHLCLTPVVGLPDAPLFVGPVILVWLAAYRFARRWAAPLAMAVAFGLSYTSHAVRSVGPGDFAPHLVWTTPTWSAAALVSIALPLFAVTMASQNIPGVAVLASFGYRAPVRPVLLMTGALTVAGAGYGVHALNFAAISAALSAGPEAGPDPAKRWRAAAVSGAVNLVLGLMSAGLVAIVLGAPHGVVLAAAGLALVPTFALSLRSAFGADEHGTTRVEAAAATFLVAASGLTVVGIGAAFWGLLAGIMLSLLLRS